MEKVRATITRGFLPSRKERYCWRSHGEVVVGLVDQYGDVGRQPIHECFDLAGWGEGSGRIVGIAQINQRASLRRFGHHGVEIVRVVGGERDLDDLGAVLLGVPGDGFESGISQDERTIGAGESVGRHLQDLSGPDAEDDLLGRDVVVRGDAVDEFAILVIRIAIRFAERGFHGGLHAGERSVGILVRVKQDGFADGDGVCRR